MRTLTANEYPKRLAHIPEPPDTLYIRGTLPPVTHKLLAVVGSRKCTSYGKEVTQYLLTGLRGAPVSIVSGLALGIDAHAHKVALEQNLHTIALPGSGLDDSVLYPRSHASLANHIVESGGALISEYEPIQRAAPWTFPKRNRLMAGMADAVLIVEATERSGTLITARLATEYNTDVLVVPASIFAPSSFGAHQFLKLGARPITHPGDLRDALGFTTADDTSPPTQHALSDDEQELYALLEEPLTRDALIERSTLNTSHANICLSRMELDGVVVERMGKLHRA